MLSGSAQRLSASTYCREAISCGLPGCEVAQALGMCPSGLHLLDDLHEVTQRGHHSVDASRHDCSAYAIVLFGREHAVNPPLERDGPVSMGAGYAARTVAPSG